MDSPNFSNQQQERIYRRLKDLVGSGSAAFWRDACRLMEMEPPLESTTHFVGHSLREIESSLRDVLEPLANPKRSNPDLIKCPSCKHKFPKPDQSPTHRDEITTILQALNIPDTDDVAQTWLKLPGQNNEYGLHKRAHRNDLAPPRSVDEEFRQFWSEIQSIFDIVLDRFETLYSKVYSLLDELLKKLTPTKDDIKQLRLNIPNSFVALNYFFGQLQSSQWLMPLQKKHFFEDPPDSDLPWPQSRYLVRMASQEPAIVLEIAQEILQTGTKNIFVHEDLVDAARVMPP